MTIKQVAKAWSWHFQLEQLRTFESNKKDARTNNAEESDTLTGIS